MSSIRSLLAKLRQPSSANDSDRMLLARFASTGDDAAFAAIVDRHGSLVFGVCRRTLRDTQLAEDAFQAVFLVLARKANSVNVRDSLANWLYVVARRIAVKASQRRSKAAPLEDVAGSDSDSNIEKAELLRVLDEELSRLPEKYRSPLVVFHLQDRTQDETAALLGWSLSTVRRRLEAGRELLHKRLTSRGITLGITAVAVAATTAPKALAEEAIQLAVRSHAGEILSPHLLELAREGLPMKKILLGVSMGLMAAVGVGVAVVASDPPKPKEEPKLVAAPVAPNAKWATIKGQIVWAGDAPKAKEVNVTSDQAHCLSRGAIISDELIINAKNKGLKNVWVYLRPDSDDNKAKFLGEQIHPDLAKPKSKEHSVDQPCCQFVPRILAVREGDTIHFKNSSPVPHNVNYQCNEGEEFNRTMVAGGTHKAGPLKASRMPARFNCNIHPWMGGSVMVFDHPYFALTDADGNFEIKNAPVGKFRVMYRHELGYHKGREGAKGFPITITGPTMTLEALKFEAPTAPK